MLTNQEPDRHIPDRDIEDLTDEDLTDEQNVFRYSLP
jgi:hypothetical protein